jgi:hypothetical protein
MVMMMILMMTMLVLHTMELMNSNFCRKESIICLYIQRTQPDTSGQNGTKEKVTIKIDVEITDIRIYGKRSRNDNFR